MRRSFLAPVCASVLGLAFALAASPAHAQCKSCNSNGCNFGGGGGGGAFMGCSPVFFHYPYHYFPHNYWPSMGPKWPEPIGAAYLPPPAYMAYPPFREPNWRYEWWQPQSYYRGSHFWLDVF